MRGYFGIGVFHPKTEENIGTLFRSAYAFGASFLFTVGRRYKRQASDTSNVINNVPVFHYQTVEELKNGLPINCPLVGVELTPTSKPLNNYVHFNNACYMLGAEDHGIPPSIMETCHHTLIIPGAKHCLNVAVAGSIVLYDRVMKDLQK